MTDSDQLQSGVFSGQLLLASTANVAAYLGADLPAWAHASIRELLAKRRWGELNDRFYREL